MIKLVIKDKLKILYFHIIQTITSLSSKILLLVTLILLNIHNKKYEKSNKINEVFIYNIQSKSIEKTLNF
jgi:hypothetical protein